MSSDQDTTPTPQAPTDASTTDDALYSAYDETELRFFGPVGTRKVADAARKDRQRELDARNKRQRDAGRPEYPEHRLTVRKVS